MCEGAAVREGDELREGVGTLGSTEECGVAALRADECCALGCGDWNLAGWEDARCRGG